MPKIVMEKRYKRAPECAFREIDGEAFIVSSKTGGVHLLNPVGTHIWSLLDGNKTLRDVAEAVTEEFDVSAWEAAYDVEEFMRKLADMDLIIELPG